MSTGVRNRVKQMMKTRRIKKWLMGLTVAAAIALQGMTALAAQEFVPGKTGSITIVPSFTNDKSEATPIADSASFDIYKVGEVKPGTSVTEFDLTDVFADFDDVAITKKTMEDKAAVLPIALSKYAADPSNGISREWTTVSNKPDTGVPEGLYLAIQTSHFEHYYDVLPFLIIMPEGSETGYEYEVKAMPKTTKRSSSGNDNDGGSSSAGGPGGNPSTDPNGPTGKPTVEPEGEVGRVLGAVRDKLADTPVGRVLGASRRAKTGDESSMRTYGVVFCGGFVLLAAWGVTYKKKKRRTNEA